MERWKQSEIVKNVVDMFEIHKPTVFLAEMDKGWQDLEVEIRKLAMFRNLAVPRIKWVPTQTGAKTPLQKAKRIKKLEGPLAFGNLWFVDAEWNDAVFAQFTKMDGGIFTESNSHRKLDAPDCIGLLYEHFGPKMVEEPKVVPDAKKQQEAEEEFERQRRLDMHSRMFGGVNAPRPKTDALATRSQPQPRVAPFPRGGNSAVLPGVMTRRGKP